MGLIVIILVVMTKDYTARVIDTENLVKNCVFNFAITEKLHVI